MAKITETSNLSEKLTRFRNEIESDNSTVTTKLTVVGELFCVSFIPYFSSIRISKINKFAMQCNLKIYDISLSSDGKIIIALQENNDLPF